MQFQLIKVVRLSSELILSMYVLMKVVPNKLFVARFRVTKKLNFFEAAQSARQYLTLP